MFCIASLCLLARKLKQFVSPEPVVLQMLLKHHPTVSNLNVTIQLKDLKKVLRTICLFKDLRELGLHVKGGSQVHRTQPV